MCIRDRYCTVDKESAVQKPSSKRRIAYVSGTLEAVSYTHLDVYKRQI